jgi:hypothetical protein
MLKLTLGRILVMVFFIGIPGALFSSPTSADNSQPEELGHTVTEPSPSSLQSPRPI